MPDQIIREIPLIARYARHNEADDLRFRAYVKFQCRLSNAELDQTVTQITDEVWKQIDCLSCANCCRTLQPTVDKEDIGRLSARLGISARAFKRRYTRTDPMDNSLCINRAPCPFLGADNRCTVYEDRPKACRDFPYLHAGGFRSRTYMMMENTAVCPIVFNTWRELKRRLRRKPAEGWQIGR